MTKKIEKLSEQEEIHWNQRSRVNWLQYGDRNTKFFHASATQRRKTNFIKGLLNDIGDWCSDLQDMTDITRDYFSNIFSSSNSRILIQHYIVQLLWWIRRKMTFFVLQLLNMNSEGLYLIYIRLKLLVLMASRLFFYLKLWPVRAERSSRVE